MDEPTYIFRDGNVYTLVDNKVVASVKEADFGDQPPAETGGHPIEGEVQMPPAPDGLGGEGAAPCPTCGTPSNPGDQFCPQCGTPKGGEQEYNGDFGSLHSEGVLPPGDFSKQVGQQPLHTGKQIVTTPNGLKGRVLARVPSLWGEEVTIRFENGNIAKIPVDKDLTFTAAEKPESPESPVKGLEERIAATTSSDLESLVARAKELRSIKAEARKLVADSTDVEAVTLDRLSVEADYELREVNAALAHLSDLAGKGYEAPSPIESLPAVEQAHIGGSEANWLDTTLNELTYEASAEDYTKLMDEGPEAFVASLDDAQLADAGTTRVMASREIRSHTAGADDSVRDNYERVWLARVEEQRRARFTSRKEEVRKEASSDEPINVPDESLFL